MCICMCVCVCVRTAVISYLFQCGGIFFSVLLCRVLESQFSSTMQIRNIRKQGVLCWLNEATMSSIELTQSTSHIESPPPVWISQAVVQTVQWCTSGLTSRGNSRGTPSTSRQTYLRHPVGMAHLKWHSDVWRPCWRHQMETFSGLLAICAGNSTVPVNSPRKGPWRGALTFSFVSAWINGWVNNGEAGDLRSKRAHYDIIVMDHTLPSIVTRL